MFWKFPKCAESTWQIPKSCLILLTSFYKWIIYHYQRIGDTESLSKLQDMDYLSFKYHDKPLNKILFLKNQEIISAFTDTLLWLSGHFYFMIICGYG